MRSPGPATLMCRAMTRVPCLLQAGWRGKDWHLLAHLVMPCVGDQPCAGVRTAPGAVGARGWIWCSYCPGDVRALCVTYFLMLLLHASPMVTSWSPSAQGTSSCPLLREHCPLPAAQEQSCRRWPAGTESGSVPEPSLVSPCLVLHGWVSQHRSSLATSRAGCVTQRNQPLVLLG